MRSIDEYRETDNKDQIEAIKMIARGLDALGKVNAEMALHFQEAINNMPKPEKLDLSPLIGSLNREVKPVSYVFTIERDGAGRMKKVEANPR